MNGNYPHIFCATICLCLSLLSCEKSAEELTPAPIFPALGEIPKGFPAMPVPADNAFTQSRWELGKKLFFDPVLSVDGTKSCASCHLPAKAFSDETAVSFGVEERPGRRNTPSLANIGYHPYFTREGGVPTLEMQVLVPLQEEHEFDFNIVLAAERLQADRDYVRRSLAAYDRAPDAFVITRALACFERSLVSGSSAYDRYIIGEDASALSAAARRGMQLFFSAETACADCHAGFNFTDYSFANNGLYLAYADAGRRQLTGEETDEALFKTPSLRNVALTAPYMHDGSVQTLEEVVTHYNSGGQNHPNRSEKIRPLHLTDTEQADLAAFLRSLTDEGFVSNPLFFE